MTDYNWCLSCKNICGSPVCVDCFYQATYSEGLIIHRVPSEYIGDEKGNMILEVARLDK